MHFKKILLIFIILITAFIFSCGEEEKEDIYLSGTIDLKADDPSFPDVHHFFVAVATTMDLDLIEKNSLDYVKELAYVNNYPDFSIDLSESGLESGDKVYIVAFLDNDYVDGKIPTINTGDVVGFYMDEEELDMAYTLKSGHNQVAIDINRIVYDFEASVAGTVTTQERGGVILAAYTGEITSYDFTNLDKDAIIGFKEITVSAGTTPFEMEIQPYGVQLPIDNVYVFAFLDRNNNNKPDAGDIWGSLEDEDGYPSTTFIPISGGQVDGLEIIIENEIEAPAGHDMTLSVSFSSPAGYTRVSPPVFIIVSKSDNPDDLLNNPMDCVKIFEKVPAGATSLELDLSGTSLAPDDEVMIIALWDRDYNPDVSDFPRLTEGDIIGYYLNSEHNSYIYTLEGGDNSVEIDLNKTVYDYDASLTGAVTTTEGGNIILAAYTGAIDSYNFNTMNTDDVVAYKTMTVNAGTTAYEMDIMPYGVQLPIDNVYVFAFLDRNNNNEPDAGDAWGSLEDEDGYPRTISVPAEGGAVTGLNIIIKNEIEKAAGYDMSLTGKIVPPPAYGIGSPPVFIIVSKSDNPDDLLNNPMDCVKTFVKIPTGETDFSLDLSETSLKPDDEVMIIALWDLDYSSGLPKLTEGDILGYYLNSENNSSTYILENGGNYIEIDLDKTVYDYDASLAGAVTTAEGGNIILTAYTGEIDSLDFDNFNTDDIIAYKTMSVNAGTTAYKMDIMPFGVELPQNHVYVFAFLDRNNNNEPDAGDAWGSLVDSDGYPRTVSIPAEGGAINGLNITIENEIEQAAESGISLSGNFIRPAGYDESSPPVFILVSKSDNPEDLLNDPMGSVKTFKKIPAGQLTFDLDLSATSLTAGDEVMIIALWDKDYTTGFPRLTDGDMLGYYLELNTYSFTYELKEGANTGLSIELERTYTENSAYVEGSILGDDSGDVIIIAYTGEFDSMDISLETDKIMGYETITKGAFPESYSMSILPFSQMPIEKAYIIAVLDSNSNGRPDDGERLGFYRETGSDYPAQISIPDTVLSGIDIEFTMDYSEPDEDAESLYITGSINPPSGYSSDPDSKPIFIIVAVADDPTALIEDPLGSMKYFLKLPQGETDYAIDVARAGLEPGDEVMIIVLWDKDYEGGFPNLTEEDVIGYYLNTDTYSQHYVLNEGVNTVPVISPQQSYHDNNARVEGTITCGDGESGNVIIIAYAGEINSMDFDVDTTEVIGYESMTGIYGDADYSMDILPFSTLPQEDVYIIAILDVNLNNIPDAGDRMGYYSDSDTGMPLLVTIEDAVLTGIDISFSMDYFEPVEDADPIVVSGTIEVPDEYISAEDPGPLFILFAEADDPSLLLDDPVGTMKYFLKLAPGETTFSVDLARAGLAPGDDVMIIALWDHDYTAGFPNLTEGDMLGYYIDEETYQFQYVLAQEDNPDVAISINKTYGENDAAVQGTIQSGTDCDIILIAYAGEIKSMDMDIDTEQIIGYSTMHINAGYTDYSLEMLPFGSFPVENVYVFAIQDNNSNGIPDNGDRFGFYTNNEMGVPDLITVPNGTVTDIDLEFMMDYIDPDPDATPMTLTGSFTRPSGYTSDPESKPIFILLASTQNTFDLFDDPMSVIRYFVKLPQGETEFTIDLAAAGFTPGEEIRIFALWDRNYTAGFPNLDVDDKIGYYQYEDQETGAFFFSKVMEAGVNTVNPGYGWSFALDQTYRDHNIQIQYQFDIGDLPGGTATLKDRNIIIVVAQQSGIDDSWTRWWEGIPTYNITDMDCVMVLDFKVLDVGENGEVNLNTTYTTKIFPIIYDSLYYNTNITSYNPLTFHNVYIYAIVDMDGDAFPSSNDYVGFYWETKYIFFFPIGIGPRMKDEIHDGINILDRKIRFSDMQF